MRDFLDSIPFGAAPFFLLLIGLVTGAWLLVNPVRRPEANVRLWTFEYGRNQIYQAEKHTFEQAHPGAKVDIQYMVYSALQSRLRSAFWADLDVPDIVELEISHAGGFFRGPLEHVGFTDLTPFLQRDGLMDKFVETRFAPYHNRGKQFGLPLDLHPVMLAYRRDLFEEYGINPDDLRTWDDFHEAGLRITEAGRRYMIQLSDSGSFQFEMLLFQNGGGYFDAEGNLTLDSEITLETLKLYIPMVAGARAIAIDLGTDQAFTQAIEEGYFLCIMVPDWLANYISTIAPRASGRMALMPLPAFYEGGRRTSTAGGSMIGITAGSEDPELAWEFIKHFWLNTDSLEKRFAESGVLPAYREAWGEGAFSNPSAFYSGQALGEVFAAVADDVPPQYASPYVNLAKTKMADVISASSTYYRRNGDAGFEEFARARLARAAAELERAMTRNPFE